MEKHYCNFSSLGHEDAVADTIGVNSFVRVCSHSRLDATVFQTVIFARRFVPNLLVVTVLCFRHVGLRRAFVVDVFVLW
jgi:hypothetical protein